jgi:aminopeptidase YwaD
MPKHDGHSSEFWRARAAAHLAALCAGRDRRPGSAENLTSTTYVADALSRYGWPVTQPEFDVVGWEGGDGGLTVADHAFGLHASPYGLGVDGSGPLVVAGTLEELAGREIGGAIVVVRGGLTAQPLTPKAFPFYQVEEHRRLIELLESARPTAVVAATGRCPEMAGAVEPFPFIEDGDFAIPAGHVDEATGAALAQFAGAPARITLEGRRWPARARNVVARRGGQRGRITVSAHIDTKVGTPGAIDNAAGVVALLLLAEVLDPATPAGVELLVVNGEDYFNAAGEVQYLCEQRDDLGDVALAINIDGAGYRVGRTAYSLYNCDDQLADHARRAFAGYGLVEGPQWWQSDHAVFAMRGRPAVALTSERLNVVLERLAHTAGDTVDEVEVDLLVQAARALRAVIAGFPATDDSNAV